MLVAMQVILSGVLTYLDIYVAVLRPDGENIFITRIVSDVYSSPH